MCLLVLVGVALPIIHTMKKAVADLDRLIVSTKRAQASLDAVGQRIDQELEEDEHTAALIDEGEGRREHRG